MSDEVNTKINFKFDGKDMTYDISNPDQLNQAVNDIQLGLLHKKKKDEMAAEMKDFQAIKSKADMYDKLDTWMAGIRANKADPELFIKTIEESTGLKLSVKNKEDIRSGDEDVIEQIMKKFEKLEKSVENNKLESQWRNEERAVHLELSQKWNGKDGMPAYVLEDIEKYCKETGFYMNDPKEQFSKAYILLNEKKIEEAQKEREKQKELELKRKHDFVDSGGNKALDFQENPIERKGKSYSKLAEEAAERLKAKGVPVFIDDD